MRGTDKSKADLINLMPYHLWIKVLRKLERLTPNVGQPWTLKWARKASDFEKDHEELSRMRRLVSSESWGSKPFLLRLEVKHIGLGGMSAVRALATVLEEELRKDKLPRYHYLRKIDLDCNRFNDEHLEVLATVFSRCRMLQILSLS